MACRQIKLTEKLEESIYYQAFRKPKDKKHRVYSEFDAPKRCF